VDAPRHAHLPDQLRRRHHREPRASRRDGRLLGRRRHGAHPFIGYAASAALAKTALLTHRNVGDLVVEAGLMTRDEVDKQLSPARLSGLEAITQAIPVVQPAENLVES
jgi:hypothetical protein